MTDETEGKRAILKKQLTLGQVLAPILLIILVTAILTTQLCYRFMYLPALHRSQQQLADLTEQYEEKDALIKELKSIKALFDGKYVGTLDQQALIEAALPCGMDKQ